MARNKLNGKVTSAEGGLYSYRVVGEKSIDTYIDLYKKIFKQDFTTVKVQPTTEIFFIRKEDEGRIIGLLGLTDECDHIALEHLGFTPGYNQRELEMMFVKALSERYQNFVVFPQNKNGVIISEKLGMKQLPTEGQVAYGTTMRKGPVTVSRATA